AIGQHAETRCWLENFSQKRSISSLGGLEPPSFRLTAERANQLRHRDCAKLWRGRQAVGRRVAVCLVRRFCRELTASLQAAKARLAQSVEHETLNLRVVGSSPTLGVVFS